MVSSGDNLSLVGSKDDLIRSWNLLCELRLDRGLHVRVDKCELRSTVDSDRLDIEIKRNDTSGLEVLRAALGTSEFMYMKLNERIEKIRVLFEKLDYLDDSHCALGILRHCIGTPKWCMLCVVKLPQVQLLNPLKSLMPNSAKNLRISLELFFQKKPELKQPCA